jgi:hypothetical protein
MSLGLGWNRRSLLKLFNAAWATNLFAHGEASYGDAVYDNASCGGDAAGTIPAVLSDAPFGATGDSTRVTYRADAVILLFGISIFSKSGVGSGFAFVEDHGAPGTRRYGFAGGSWPDRAHGLNRLGYIHEDIVEVNGAYDSARYFGFMTTAHDEEKMDEAREALKNGTGENLFTAIHGESRRGAYSARMTHFESPGAGGWRIWRTIAAAAERSFAGACVSDRVETGTPPDPATSLPTMLYSILRFREGGFRPGRTLFIYAGVPRELVTTVASDPRAGERLRQRGLARQASSVVHMTGVTRNVKTGAKTRFHVWWDRDTATPLPLRVELEPRSFLRLAFEADRSIQV